MQPKQWIIGLTALLVFSTVVGCAPTAGPDVKRARTGGMNALEIGPGAQRQDVPRFDNKNIDVDGDGDREHLAGRNDIANPSVDLRSFAHPNGGSDLTQGVYPHTFTADRIASLASSVNGIANAQALVVGRTVVLGMNLERGVKPHQKPGLVQYVRQRILVQAPEFQRVHITTDRQLTRRIQRISDELRSGHSLTMFNDDFMDLTRQIPPVGPSASPAVPIQ
jgi:hypothetical protein